MSFFLCPCCNTFPCRLEAAARRLEPTNAANYGLKGWGYKGSTLGKAAWRKRKRQRQAHKAARRRNRS